MNDIELLKLAAKAAGYDDAWWSEPFGYVLLRSEGNRAWNPLTNDGDAFRLACDLGLRVFPVARTESGAACSAVGAVTGERLSKVADTLPTRTATRLAIVRAAAEIGRNMK